MNGCKYTLMIPKNNMVSAQFLENAQGARALCTTHAATAPARAWLLAIPPFAEEMMKARQQFTQLARELQPLGLSTVILDVRGTGDAEGELADFTWDDWCSDVKQTYETLARTGLPVYVLGLRLGALLALNSLEKAQTCAAGIVLWEPQFAGKMALKQFLRVGTMSAKMAGKEADASDGNAQEVGGYLLSAAFQASVNEANAPLSLPAARALVVKIASDADVLIPPGWQKTFSPWRDGGVLVDIDTVQFPAFWTTPEIIASAELSQKTSHWLQERLAQ
jgi:exosortase A-associated hydrolase 2